MSEKQRFDLPRLVESEHGEEEQKELSTSPEEARMKAQEMWDAFRDIATAWSTFVHKQHREEIKERIEYKKKAEKAEEMKPVLGESRSDIKALFFNLDHPLTQEFRNTPIYKRLAKQIGDLYRDTAVREAWQEGMAAHAAQWEGVNGTWTEYLQLRKDERALEQARDELLREKFDEQQLAPSRRRRTLATDLTNADVALETLRVRTSGLERQDPGLAAKILAHGLEERRRELQSKEGFMWFPSRKRIRELVAEKIAHRTSLRILNFEGEAGTGKTTLARAIARLFTGNEPLKITCGRKMKADRALFADKELEAGSSPTVYRIVLAAVTGKDRADGTVHHDGRAALLDELNTSENDEVRILVTNCDSMRAGQPTGYHLNGANPDDRVQPHALILAAQNLAGGRFSDRTVFTPEVKRKMDIIQVEYPPLTQENPELYESFLVALMDADGRITASKEELATAWKKDTVLERGKIYETEKYNDDDKAGGVLWRFAKLLDASYKSFYGKSNVLTDTNPDARLTGEPLTPGDVYTWLSEYRDARKRQQSLASFLSEKYFTWIDQKFRAESDIGNKELYLHLGKHFAILTTHTADGELGAFPKTKARFDLLTHKDIAYLSPRVPRRKELISEDAEKPGAEAQDWKSMTIDAADDDGQEYTALAMRIDQIPDRRRWVFKTDPSQAPYRHIGVIKECGKNPNFVGQYLFEQINRPEQKRITREFWHAELLPAEKHIVRVESRKKDIINPFAEVLAENGVSGKEKLDQFQVDLGEILEVCKQTYRAQGLDAWADALPSSVADSVSGDPKQQERFEAYLKEGRIPVFMPPASIQRETLKSMLQVVNNQTRFTHFKPVVFKDGAQTLASDGYVGWDHLKNLMESKDPSLVTGVPDRCYIMWEKPTQKPEATSKTLTDQKKYIQDAQTKFKRDHNVTEPLIGGMMPAEYLALQIAFSAMAQEHVQKGGVSIQTLNPLDKDTYTRLPGVKESDGSVAVALWNPGGSQLRLVRNVVVALSVVGVRLPVRE